MWRGRCFIIKFKKQEAHFLILLCEKWYDLHNILNIKIDSSFSLWLYSSGNIRVFCRCRPLSKEEVSSGCATVVDFDAAKDGDLGIHTGSSSKKIYKFDRVYTPRDNQGMQNNDKINLGTSVVYMDFKNIMHMGWKSCVTNTDQNHVF